MKRIEPLIVSYVEKAEFPQFVRKEFRDLGWGKVWAPVKWGGLNYNALERHSSAWEMAKVDTSMTTFCGVHTGLGTATIAACADDEQAQRFLPDCY